MTSPSRTFALTLLALALVLCLSACTGQRLSGLPPQLLGEWKTTDARYQGRSMNLTADRITFGMGGVAPDRPEQVKSVRLVTADNTEEYRIDLRTSDAARDSLILDFTQENGGQVHLKSQPRIIWTKVKPSTQLPVPASPKSAAPAALELPVITTPLLTNEHRTIYKVDCIRPKICKSY